MPVLKENLSRAITAYISRVNGCPCGDTTIQLYCGADSTSEYLMMRPHLLTFLKGSKAAKEKMRRENSEMYAEFQFVWDIRRRHLVHGLPAQYIFLLVCCFEQECRHPICQKGRPGVIPSWYEGGPPITHIPLPVADGTGPWGNLTCNTCEGFCAGHYNHQFIDVKDKSAIAICIPPPSIVLKNEFSKLKEYPPTQDFIADVAKKVLLTPEVVRLWLDHLHTVLLNRKRGAKKAAATRAKTRTPVVESLPFSARDTPSQLEVTTTVTVPQSTGGETSSDPRPVVHETAQSEGTESYYCGTCKKEYKEESDADELWIGCDMCEQ